jgi:hypothetical protein
VLETRKGRFGEDQLKVVVFDYDRSFERFFFLRLKQLYGLTDGEANASASRLEVVHVHGSLGDCAFRNVPYNVTAPTSDLIRKASASMRIVSEGTARP